ncbi:MAG: 4a-hydroxytetrahydrobiopterin dehydratase [Cyanobacteria bacterium P01_D01_bin.44]
MTTTLLQETCVPCRGKVPPVPASDLTELMAQIPHWSLIKQSGEPRLQRVYHFKDFMTALAFTQQVGEIAETEGHHPAILTEWGQVTVTWWTHTIRNLHRNDFIMAAKTDEVRTLIGA